MESFAHVIVAALLDQESFRSALLVPLLEYLDSAAASKTFLESPFSGIVAPKTGGRLRISVATYDLLGTRCGEPILIDTIVKPAKPSFIPLRQIMEFERE